MSGDPTLSDQRPNWSYAANPPGSLPFEGTPVSLPPKWSAPAADAPPSDIWQKLNPQKISCVGSSCGNALHCFRLTRQLAKNIGPGTCRECKQPLVSMERVARRDLSDVDHTFSALQLEYVRHYFWHVPFGDKALAQARRAGRIKLDEGITTRLHQRIASAEPYHDGWQTPTAASKADALDYAMHAVAACCRKCAQYWHGVASERPLSEAEIVYLGELMRRYLRSRLPDLDDGPRRQPRSAHSSNVHQLQAHVAAPNEGTASALVVQPYAS